MPEIKTEFLFKIALDIQVSNLGDTPYGSRRIGQFGLAAVPGEGSTLPPPKADIGRALSDTHLELTPGHFQRASLTRYDAWS